MPTTYYYTVDDEIIGEHTVGQSRIDYLTDALGSVVATVDQTQAVKSSARYKPLGDILAFTGPKQSFGWMGSNGFLSTSRPHAGLSVYAMTYSVIDADWLTPALTRSQRKIRKESKTNPTSNKSLTGRRTPKPHHIPPNRGSFVGGWNYGAYCGSSVQQNPAWNVLPQDCIDQCCQQHDRCLEAQYGAGLSGPEAHGCCDAGLANCAADIFQDVKDCCENSPSPSGCWWAVDTITYTFDKIATYLFNPSVFRCNCVPPNLWHKYSVINWGSECSRHPLDKHVPSPYGCGSSGSNGGPEQGGGSTFPMSGVVHSGRPIMYQ